MQLQFDDALGQHQMAAYVAQQLVAAKYAKAGRSMEANPSAAAVQRTDELRVQLVAALRHAADALEIGFPFSAVHAKH